MVIFGKRTTVQESKRAREQGRKRAKEQERRTARRDTGIFSMFCPNIKHKFTGLSCAYIVFFFADIGLFCGDIGLFTDTCGEGRRK